MLLIYIEVSAFPELFLLWDGQAQPTFKIEMLGGVDEVKYHMTF